ncbi:MAG: hypothetical protein F4053_14145, partial [Proteobacteria bacterium]|nr:hypothetical protein [Pseudomonadota bacterium]
MPRIKVEEKIIGYGVVRDTPEPARAGSPEAQSGQPEARAGNQRQASVQAQTGDQKGIQMHEKHASPEKLV